MSKELILSIRAGHNASACIGGRDGLIFGIQEERLTGEKNYWGFPAKSIRACLDAAGAKPADLLSIACGERRMATRYHSRDDVLRAYARHGSLIGRLRQRVAMP